MLEIYFVIVKSQLMMPHHVFISYNGQRQVMGHCSQEVVTKSMVTAI